MTAPLSALLLLEQPPKFPDISLDASLVNNLVDVVGRDARSNRRRSNIENFSGQAANLAHAILSLGVQLLDLVGANHAPVVLGDAILCIVGARYRRRNFASRGKGVNGAERAGEVERGEGVEVVGFYTC